MNSPKPNIVLFGTGTGGENGYRYYRKQSRILGFVDNDPNKQGATYCGLPVLSPDMIRDFECDSIVICSMYVDEIQEQLTQRLGVPVDKIDILDEDIRNYGSINWTGLLVVLIGIAGAATVVISKGCIS